MALQDQPPELGRRLEEMAGGALPAGIVSALGDVAGQAEAARRQQRGDTRGGMTGRTGCVSFPRMGGAILVTIVTLDAIPHLGVMLVMAALAGAHAVGRRDLRGTVTVGARHRLMLLMPECHGACRGRAGHDPHTDGSGAWRSNLVRRMTAGAIRGGDLAAHQILVVAEIASARRLEGEA